jgi:hypothetical protein
MYEWQHSEIFAIEIEQVKCDEHALATTEEQITQHRPASLLNTSNLSVENGAFTVLSMQRQSCV